MANQMLPEYEPKTFNEKLGYLIEEAGEVLAAAGKTIRWGLESTNPDYPGETNAEWLERELVDLKRAIRYVTSELESFEKGKQ